MKKIDLNALSKEDLLELKSDVEKALASLEQRRKAEAKKAAEDAARQFGFSLDDIVGKAKGARKGGPAKFRNPADPTQTWSGRGRQPGWIKEGLAKGKKLSDYEI